MAARERRRQNGLMEMAARDALIIACARYEDAGLAALRSPAHDVQALAEVLSNPDIGAFQVRSIIDSDEVTVRRAVATFFANRSTDDTLLVHFSCHGVKGDDGLLYFATRDTELASLDATAVPAEFVHRQMNKSRSRRVVLMLDCCYSGAFARGLHRGSVDADISEQFAGRGRSIITASSEMEYAFDSLGEDDAPSPSVFTSAVVDGLRTGDADRGGDGVVSVDELYDYVFDRVRRATPNQSPRHWTFDVEGELIVANSPRGVTAPFSADIEDALTSPFPGARIDGVMALQQLLDQPNRRLADHARSRLAALSESDDSQRVRDAARAALGLPPTAPADSEPAQTAVAEPAHIDTPDLADTEAPEVVVEAPTDPQEESGSAPADDGLAVAGTPPSGPASDPTPPAVDELPPVPLPSRPPAASPEAAGRVAVSPVLRQASMTPPAAAAPKPVRAGAAARAVEWARVHWVWCVVGVAVIAGLVVGIVLLTQGGSGWFRGRGDQWRQRGSGWGRRRRDWSQPLRIWTPHRARAGRGSAGR